MAITTGIKAYQDHLKALSGGKMDARPADAGNDFKQLLDASATNKSGAAENDALSGVSGIANGIVGSGIDALHKAEAQAALAAEGKADPLEVAHAVNTASLAAEQMTTVLSKAINAYQELLRLPM